VPSYNLVVTPWSRTRPVVIVNSSRSKIFAQLILTPLPLNLSQQNQSTSSFECPRIFLYFSFRCVVWYILEHKTTQNVRYFHIGTPLLDLYHNTKFPQPWNFYPVHSVSDFLVHMTYSYPTSVCLACQRGRNTPPCHQCHHKVSLPDVLLGPNIIRGMSIESVIPNSYSSASATKKRKQKKLEFGWQSTLQLLLSEVLAWVLASYRADIKANLDHAQEKKLQDRAHREK